MTPWSPRGTRSTRITGGDLPNLMARSRGQSLYRIALHIRASTPWQRAQRRRFWLTSFLKTRSGSLKLPGKPPGAVFPSDAEAGLELGRNVAARVIEYAKIDGVKWTGTIPPGPGHWKGENP